MARRTWGVIGGGVGAAEVFAPDEAGVVFAPGGDAAGEAGAFCANTAPGKNEAKPIISAANGTQAGRAGKTLMGGSSPTKRPAWALTMPQT